MKVETKTYGFKVDGIQKDGVIRGFASTFGNIDLGGDVVEKGAFKRTISQSKGFWPILADHDPTKHIGWNLRAEETDKGLYVEGQIDLNTQAGKEKFSLASKAQELGAKMGLSIGYMVEKAIPDPENPTVRRLKELKMFEYSIVTFPMNTMAYVTGVKAAKELDEAMRAEQLSLALKQWTKLGFSQKDFHAAFQKTFGTALTMNDSGHVANSLDAMIALFKK